MLCISYGHKLSKLSTLVTVHTAFPSLNSSIGEGGGTLEAPQDKYGQEHRTGTSRVEQTDRDHGGAGSSGSHGGAGSSGGHGGAGSSGGHGGAGSSGGHGGVGSSGGHGRWYSGPWPRSPRPGPYSRNSYYPPKKKFPGEVRGYQEPSGAKQTGQTGQGNPPGPDRQDSTKQERPPGPDRQDRTGQPTGTRSPPGLAWRLRLHLVMTRSQRPTQGPSATASISATRGQAARMASLATTRGAACPKRVSMD